MSSALLDNKDQAQIWATVEARRTSNKPLHVVMGFDSMTADTGNYKWEFFFDKEIRAAAGDSGIGYRPISYLMPTWVDATALVDYAALATLAPLGSDSSFTRSMARVATGGSLANSCTTFRLPGIASKVFVWYAERYSGLPFTIKKADGSSSVTVYSGKVGGTSGGTTITSGTPPKLAVAVLDVLPQLKDHDIQIECDGTTANATISCVLYGIGAWNPNRFGVVTHQCAFSGGTFANFLTTWDATARATWFASTSPDWAVTVFGTNDGASTFSTIQTAAANFITELRTQRPAIAITWIGPLQSMDGLGNQVKIGQAVQAALDAANVGVIPFGCRRDLADIYTPAQALAAGLMNSASDVHPSVSGYQWMGSAIYNISAASGMFAGFSKRLADSTISFVMRWNQKDAAGNYLGPYTWVNGTYISSAWSSAGITITSLPSFDPNSGSGSSSYLTSVGTNFVAGERIVVMGRAYRDAAGDNTGIRIRVGGTGAFIDFTLGATVQDFAGIAVVGSVNPNRIEIRPLGATIGGTLTVEYALFQRESDLAASGIYVGSGAPTRQPSCFQERYLDYSANVWYRPVGLSVNSWVTE